MKILAVDTSSRNCSVSIVEVDKNKNIILIDDVMTTGATISDCKYILKKSGAIQIIVLTIAKSNI